jgi:hypothetical protein
MKKYAWIGIAGALTMAVSDVILLGLPVSGSYYDISSLGALEHIDPLRAAPGSMLGLVASFFICFGFWHLKKLFEPVNRTLSTILFVALSSMMFFGGAFHAGYYFLANGGMNGEPLNLVPQAVLNDFRNHLEVLSWLGVPGFLTGAILYFKLGSDSRFPRWFRFSNPLLVSGFFLGLFYVLPAPVGGYIRPTFVNAATATVFILSLKIKAA